MSAKLLAYIILGVCLGPIASVAITPIFCVLWKIFYLPFIRKKLLEKAKADGHVVEAHLIKKHNIRNHNNRNGVPLPTMEDMGTYNYEVNGKKYRYRLVSSVCIPKTVTLYYIKKPRKATLANDLGNWESPWIKFYLVISLVVAIIIVIVGMVML